MATGKAQLTLVLALLCMAFKASAEPVRVETRALLLAPESPATLVVGGLRFLGGLEMASPNDDFGGFSALAISTDGKRLNALTDRGRRLSADLSYGPNGYLAGISAANLYTLSAPDGRPIRKKRDADAEAMVSDVDGAIIVAFERDHRLWRYPSADAKPHPMTTPSGLSSLPKNSGIEALTRLSNGTMLAIAEGPKQGNETRAWIETAKGWSALTYALSGGFRVTGAATLPGGDVLVLERRYTLLDGVAVRLRRIRAETIGAGTHLTGQLIAEIRPPITVDNFESIDIRQDESRRTLVYMISDDNFNPLQRNLLMMFELME